MTTRFKDRLFDVKLDRSGKCWLWLGYTVNGYGRVRRKNRNLQAHRYAWALVRGPIPKGMDVLHKCDNTLCSRPSHLFLGTDLDNVRDCMRKGRRANLRGERCPWSKLSASDVKKIRASKQLLVTLSARYGVSVAQLSRIRNNRRWQQ